MVSPQERSNTLQPKVMRPRRTAMFVLQLYNVQMCNMTSHTPTELDKHQRSGSTQRRQILSHPVTLST